MCEMGVRAQSLIVSPALNFRLKAWNSYTSCKREPFPSPSKKLQFLAKGPEADKIHKEYALFQSFAGKFSLVKPSKLK